jgi:hypothetical protein
MEYSNQELQEIFYEKYKDQFPEGVTKEQVREITEGPYKFMKDIVMNAVWGLNTMRIKYLGIFYPTAKRARDQLTRDRKYFANGYITEKTLEFREKVLNKFIKSEDEKNRARERRKQEKQSE